MIEFVLFLLNRQNPFGLTIVLNRQGNAQGDLFYDDGESIDTIGTRSYYYAKFHWSSSKRQLNFEVIENNYSEMSKLILDTITIYGLEEIPDAFYVNNKEYHPHIRASTQIVDLHNLTLPMNQNHRLTWTKTKTMIVEIPDIVKSKGNYRIDCFPDFGKNNSICQM